MCRHVIYKHSYCGCRWMQIVEACHAGAGFTHCAALARDVADAPSVVRTTRFQLCPRCDLQGLYDRNQIRMVLGTHRGVRVGCGPGRNDSGVEVRCLVM